ncbi:hypothetical protein EHS25_007172 [Saitozyma podzolica]|uniref:FAD-binding FR-type domain-containing protein n=1 Tax=Saitozyma podzolica TaxID=1890683 RepID=A0A427XPD6_9TREE|nr:hypothetical protein EHS25_007172 [Saitozyma podzolica]
MARIRHLQDRQKGRGKPVHHELLPRADGQDSAPAPALPRGPVPYRPGMGRGAPTLPGPSLHRHYTLSDAPNTAHYRITVKREREDGDASSDPSPGMVSNTLHSLPAGSDLQVSFPAGTFTIPEPLPKQVIFLSDSVGITPNLAMLNSLVDLAKPPKITWIQGARNKVEHVFARHVREIGEKSGEKFKEVVFYSKPGPDTGRGSTEALYYICGPPAFMSGMVQSLVELGVANENIRSEAFGAGEIEMA